MNIYVSNIVNFGYFQYLPPPPLHLPLPQSIQLQQKKVPNFSAKFVHYQRPTLTPITVSFRYDSSTSVVAKKVFVSFVWQLAQSLIL